MATAVKERGAQELQQDLDRLAGERQRREAGLEEVRGELAPARARKDELRRKGWDGVNVTRELAQIEERIAGLERREQDGVEDLRVGAERVAGLTQARDAAQSREDVARVEASAERRRVGLLTVAREVPQALAGVIARLDGLTEEHQTERQTRNYLTGSFDSPGEKHLERLRYLVAELLHGARALQEGRLS